MPFPAPDIDRVTRENLQARILAIVATYYPAALKLKILACCHAQLRGIQNRGCRRSLCPGCCPKESHKIAKAQYAKFESCTPPGKPVRLAHEVYTLPPYLIPRIQSKEGFAAWRDAVRDTIRELHGDEDVAGVMNFHPHGDEDITKLHPHFDVLVNGYVLTPGGRPKEHRPPHVHPDDARSIYTRWLVRHLKLSVIEAPQAVDLWYDRNTRYHTSARKTRHMVRYSARHVYQPQWAWLNDGGTKGDWYYRPQKKVSSVRIYEGRDVIENLLSIESLLKDKKRRSWFGYMQNRIILASARKFAAHKVPGELV
jgi:hypothetical protein